MIAGQPNCDPIGSPLDDLRRRPGDTDVLQVEVDWQHYAVASPERDRTARHDHRGRALYKGRDITHLSDEELRQVRSKDISTVFQGSMNSLNPVINIEHQFVDVIQTHTNDSDASARRRAEEVLEGGQHRPAIPPLLSP